MTGVWSEVEVRGRFSKRSVELETRLPSLKARSGESVSVRALHDASLAKLMVYRALLDGTTLGTLEEMLDTLAALRRDPPLSPEAMEPATFADLVRQFVDALAGQYRV